MGSVALVASAATLFLMGAWIRPLWIFACLLGLMVSPLFLHLERFHVVVYSLGGSFLLLSMLVISGRRMIIPRNAVLFSSIAYLLANSIIGIVFMGNTVWDTLGELFPWLEMLLYFVLALNLFRDRGQIVSLFKLLLVLALSKGLYELYLFFSGKLFTFKLPFLQGLTGGLTIMGMVVPILIDYNVAVVAIAVIAYLMYMPTIPLRVKVLLGASLSILLLTNVVGLSRSVNLAITVAVLFLVVSGARRERMMLMKVLGVSIVMLVGLLLVGSVGNSTERVNILDLMEYRLIDYTDEQVFHPVNEYQQLRIVEVHSALKDWSSSPIIGRGAGHVVRTDITFEGAEEDVNLHNDILGFFVHYGIIGAFLAAALAFKLASFSRRYLQNSENAFDKFLLKFSIATIFWQVVILAFEPIFLAYHIPAFIGASLGLAVAISKMNEEAPGNSALV